MSWKGLHVLRKELEEAEQQNSIYRKYRAVFGSEIGRVVLSDILRDLGVFGNLDPRDPVSNALRNYAETSLLAKAGGLNYKAAVKIMLEDVPD